MNLREMTKFRSTMRKWSLLAIVAFFSCASMFAQSKKVTGVIKDSSGDPIIGASVVVKGTTTGTVTDIDGNYSINAPENGKTLVVSYIGMKTRELAIAGSVVNATLEENSKDLDEVVVIGYGTAKKRDLTGSVSSMKSSALEDLPISSPAEAMTGKMAGVQVTTSEGSPDANIKIRVRGGGSINRSSDPLYIVDGFPVNSINDIAPSDIQSIDVLKDASSTAIYGSRGANGVIIVTTKSGKEGKVKINYSGSWGVKYLAGHLDPLDSREFALWSYEYAALKGQTGQGKVGTPYEGMLVIPVGDTNGYFLPFSQINQYDRSIDWQDKVFGETGHTYTNSISISGGGKSSTFNLSYSRIDDKAIMIGSDYTRNNMTFKYEGEPHEKLKLSFTTRYSDTKVNGAGSNDNTGGEKSTTDARLKQSILYSPIPGFAGRDEEEGSYDPETQLVNPIVSQKDSYKEKDRMNFNFNGGLSFIPIKALTLRTEVGYDFLQNNNSRYYGPSTYYSRSGVTGEYQGLPAVILEDKGSQTIRNTNTVNFDFKNIITNKDHGLTLLLGEEYIKTMSNTNTSEIQGYPSTYDAKQAFNFTSQGKYWSVNNFYNPDQTLLSFFGRANYDFRGKYLFTATFREDGSSKLAKGHQWAFFPSLAGAWRISDENFMKSSENWLSNLKLRLSYGTAGNNDVPINADKQTWSSKTTTDINISNNYWSPATRLPNDKLTWETMITRNIGIDYGFFNNRLNGSVEFYLNNTKNLLLDFDIDTSTGYAKQMRNAGKTENKGVEFTVNAVLIDKKDFSMDFNFNIGFNKNKVVSLSGLEYIPAQSGWSSQLLSTVDYMVREGEPLGQMFGYVTDGMYGLDDFVWNESSKKWELNPSNQGAPTSDITGPYGPGALKFKDIDGWEEITDEYGKTTKVRTGKPDGKIDDADQRVIGNANPDFSGGFGLGIKYKIFDLSANFTYSYGNDVYNANKLEFTTTTASKYRNLTSEVSSAKRWTYIDENGALIAPSTATGAPYLTEADAKAKLAAINGNAQIWSPYMANNRPILHSWAIEDGSFLRLSSLTIGCTIPKKFLEKIQVQQLRFYFTGYNLFCLTNYSGYDPEVDTRTGTPLTPSVDYSAYPKSRSYNFGVNLTF